MRCDRTGDAVDWLLNNGCPRDDRDGRLREPAIVDCCRVRNPGALRVLLAHGADPNFIMPAPTFSLAFLLAGQKVDKIKCREIKFWKTR